MTPTITQSDRQAAARLATLAELRHLLLSGCYDDHPYIQIVSAHRELGAKEERERMVKGWLSSIERGEHLAKGE